MKAKASLLSATVGCIVASLNAGDFTFRTFVVPGFGPNLTNAVTLSIASYEAFEFMERSDGWHGQLTKGQDTFIVGPRDIVAGPAMLRLVSGDQRDSRLVTIRVYTQLQPPDKTVVIPLGQGGLVTLQVSSNLVDWTTTTNGLHTNVPSMKFFRVNVDRVP